MFLAGRGSEIGYYFPRNQIHSSTDIGMRGCPRGVNG